MADFQWMGEWLGNGVTGSTVPYSEHNNVTYNGVYYMCVSFTPIGSPSPDTDTGHWNVILRDGLAGSSGSSGSSGNGPGGGSYSEITYNALFTLLTNSELTPGTHYLITDYETCYDRPNYDSYGNAIISGNYVTSGVVEPLLVLATSTNTLASEANSLTHPKHKIKYDITFNLTEITGSPAKGRIIERIDEKNNRADYDFVNVEFVRYEGYFCETMHLGTINIDGLGNVTGTNTVFTNDFSVGDIFAVYNENAPIGSFYFYEIESITDNFIMKVVGVNYIEQTNARYSRGLLLGSGIYMSPFPSNVPSTTSNQSLYKTFNDGDNFNTYIGDNLNYDTFILSNNVFLNGSYNNNTFGGNSIGNTFDDDMDSNTIGSYCQFNIMTNDFDRNTIGSYMQRNIIDCDMESNRIGNYFQKNMLGDDDGADFDFNLIGEFFQANFITMSNGSFMENTIGRRFYANFINDIFQDNNIVGSFTTNVITNTFEMNTIGNNFDTNVIENNFTMNTIGADFFFNTIINGTFRSNTTLNNFNNNNINGDFMYNTIGTDFYQNSIQNGFGAEGLNPRGNKIGNGFHNNTVGTSFFNNTIADSFNNNTIYNGFKNNTVAFADLSYIDFTQKVNGVTSVLVQTSESTYTDGTYIVYQTGYNPSSLDNTGNGAGFEITVSGGSITTISVNTAGKLYGMFDLIFISAAQIPGATQDLTLSVNGLTNMPLIYMTLNSTISKGFDDVNLISTIESLATGLYFSDDITGPLN